MSFRKGTDTIPKLVGGIMSGIIPLKRTPRTMKYPYTLTAKIAHFPYAHYWKNNWFFRYAIYASILCLPVFYKIQKLSYSPANVKLWEKKRREELIPHIH